MIRFSLFLILLIVPAALADWPQLLGVHRNGQSADSNVLARWPKDGPRVLWRSNVGQGWSGPVVSSNRVVMFHRTQDRETVECFDAETGARQWRNDYAATYRDDFGFEEGPRATPAIADGRVVTFGADGALTCWSLESGTNFWRVDVRQKFGSDKGFFGMACSPLVEGNAVIMNIGGRPEAGIVAFDMSSGHVLWKATQQEASYSSPVAATFGSNRVVLVLGRHALLALDPKSGNVFWEFPFRPRIQASVTAALPLVIGNDIFISASYGAGAALLRYSRSKPEVVWSGDDILSSHYATSVHHKGFLYGFDGRQEQRCRLRCVELQTGKIRWSENEFGAGTLLLVGDSLLILSEGGELVLASATPDRFRPVARAQIMGSDVRAHPAFAKGRFYARDKRTLICVDLRPE